MKGVDGTVGYLNMYVRVGTLLVCMRAHLSRLGSGGFWPVSRSKLGADMSKGAGPPWNAIGNGSCARGFAGEVSGQGLDGMMEACRGNRLVEELGARLQQESSETGERQVSI